MLIIFVFLQRKLDRLWTDYLTGWEDFIALPFSFFPEIHIRTRNNGEATPSSMQLTNIIHTGNFPFPTVILRFAFHKDNMDFIPNFRFRYNLHIDYPGGEDNGGVAILATSPKHYRFGIMAKPFKFFAADAAFLFLFLHSLKVLRLNMS